MSCNRVRETLQGHDIAIEQTQVEKKASRLGPADALKIARAADHVYVAKGKKIVHFDMRDGGPDDADLLAHLIGRSGFLRAPTLRMGARVVVGYNAQLYSELLG